MRDLKHLILLTCTVKTRMTSNMKRSDPVVRLNDYVKSIRRWNQLAKKNNWRIVIAENSNSIDSIKNSLTSAEIGNLQFIPTRLDNESHLEGNSKGEFNILQELISVHAPNYKHDYLWKITGRLFIPNFPKIANNATGELVVNRLHASKHQIDARIIGFKPILFKSMFSQSVIFSHHYPRVYESSYESMEHFLTQKTLDLEISGATISTMEQAPIFIGISGTSNKRIDDFTSRNKKRIANLLRPIVIKLLAGSSP